VEKPTLLGRTLMWFVDVQTLKRELLSQIQRIFQKVAHL
jgi:hypothetical protein